MNFKNTVLVAPINDAEAVMILLLAKALNLPAIISAQPHGASLDKEPQIIEQIKKFKVERVIIVEMPGIKTEQKISKLGIKVKIIDHHNYQNLKRGHKLSSLEQFLKLFKLSDSTIKELGFEPKLVRGIGILDRNFIWGLRQEKYSEAEIKKVFAYQKKLLRPFTDPVEDKKYEQAARTAWKKRKMVGKHTLVTGFTKHGFRRYLSDFLGLKFKQPIPIIIDERGRGAIIVQDSPLAAKLFKKFGGFTFGEKGNWGYKNQAGRKKVTLDDVKNVLAV